MNIAALPDTQPYRLSPARQEDVAPVATLLQANTASQGGALNGEFPDAKVAQMLLGQGAYAVVARREDQVVGVLFSTTSLAAAPAVIKDMLAAWPAGKQCWIYGPACVSASERGRGLLTLLYAALRQHYGAKPPVLFINATNESSRRAHERLGMHRVADFTSGGQQLQVYTSLA
ncbi:N-acetyltransferase [Enterobacterales bacterium CwR94]|nr:N-acetyltransferase [Enterobacterales bacterium CwR94]